MILFAAILALTFISGFFLPWWLAALIGLVLAFLIRTNGSAFWSGGVAVALAWLALALLKSFPNQHILANRVAKLFHLPNWVFILGVTVVIGGLVGGFSALSGSLLRAVVGPGNQPKPATAK
ncbi:hypothetical protein GCM10023149_13630 [Mucilaginibacter gynuensis]|uniref:Uncharacterized protein n=1 Tax=Mucilaginibacter gynuensis TaxID=1302236 RepID=A0ABP8G3B5_9SPHI